jgi:hypothetical protein
MDPCIAGAVGGFVTENLAIHGDVTLGGNHGIGVGTTYYFMPSDFYVSASLMLLVGGEGGSPGPGLTILGGKQWRIADKFSLGAAARLLVGQQTFDGYYRDLRFTFIAITAGVAATFN